MPHYLLITMRVGNKPCKPTLIKIILSREKNSKKPKTARSKLLSALLPIKGTHNLISELWITQRMLASSGRNLRSTHSAVRNMGPICLSFYAYILIEQTYRQNGNSLTHPGFFHLLSIVVTQEQVHLNQIS